MIETETPAVPHEQWAAIELQRRASGADFSVHDSAREAYKTSRAAAVASITVTTEVGNTFDGDEVSQGRMARAVLALQAAGADATVNWVLADNSVIQATAAELTEALALAGAEQARLWVPDSPA
jgi:phospholipase/lecithinase/hemolysin